MQRRQTATIRIIAAIAVPLLILAEAATGAVFGGFSDAWILRFVFCAVSSGVIAFTLLKQHYDALTLAITVVFIISALLSSGFDSSLTPRDCYYIFPFLFSAAYGFGAKLKRSTAIATTGLLLVAAAGNPVLCAVNSECLPFLEARSHRFIVFGTVVVCFLICWLIALASQQKDKKRHVLVRQELEASAFVAEHLLSTVLPPKVARAMLSGSDVEGLTKNYESASIAFIHLCDYNRFVSELSPADLVHKLDRIYSAFDALVDKIPHVWKIETIGSTYLVASGLPDENKYHAEDITQFLILLQELCKDVGGERVRLKIGVNSGPVSAGIIGQTRCFYRVFGSTVNIASRMMSHGEEDQIHASPTTVELLGDIAREARITITPRGPINVKGRGMMSTSFITKGPNYARGSESTPVVLGPQPQLVDVEGVRSSIAQQKQASNVLLAFSKFATKKMEGKDLYSALDKPDPATQPIPETEHSLAVQQDARTPQQTPGTRTANLPPLTLPPRARGSMRRDSRQSTAQGELAKAYVDSVVQLSARSEYDEEAEAKPGFRNFRSRAALNAWASRNKVASRSQTAKEGITEVPQGSRDHTVSLGEDNEVEALDAPALEEPERAERRRSWVEIIQEGRKQHEAPPPHKPQHFFPSSSGGESQAAQTSRCCRRLCSCCKQPSSVKPVKYDLRETTGAHSLPSFMTIQGIAASRKRLPRLRSIIRASGVDPLDSDEEPEDAAGIEVAPDAVPIKRPAPRGSLGFLLCKAATRWHWRLSLLWERVFTGRASLEAAYQLVQLQADRTETSRAVKVTALWIGLMVLGVYVLPSGVSLPGWLLATAISLFAFSAALLSIMHSALISQVPGVIGRLRHQAVSVLLFVVLWSIGLIVVAFGIVPGARSYAFEVEDAVPGASAWNDCGMHYLVLILTQTCAGLFPVPGGIHVLGQASIILVWTIVFHVVGPSSMQCSAAIDFPTAGFWVQWFTLSESQQEYYRDVVESELGIPPRDLYRESISESFVFGLVAAVIFAVIVVIKAIVVGRRHRRNFLVAQALIGAQSDANSLLENLFPAQVVSVLKAGKPVQPRFHNQVGILWCDLCNFTPLADTMSAKRLMRLLNRIYTAFDDITQTRGLWKMDTVGDAYVVLGGLFHSVEEMYFASLLKQRRRSSMVSRVTTTQRGGDPTASPPDTWADAGFDGVATSPTATANTVPGDAEESKLAAKLPVTPSPTKSSNRFSKWGKIRATIQAKEGFRWSLHMPRTPSRMQRGEKRRMSFSISNQKADPYAQMLLNMAASPQNASGAADVMAGVSETDTLTEDNVGQTEIQREEKELAQMEAHDDTESPQPSGHDNIPAEVLYRLKAHKLRHVLDDLFSMGHEMQEILNLVNHSLGSDVGMRVGVHCGSVVTGVVGSLQPRFHVFGLSMKIAELMESKGQRGKVHCSKAAKEAYFTSAFSFEASNPTASKSSDTIEGFFVTPRA